MHHSWVFAYRQRLKIRRNKPSNDQCSPLKPVIWFANWFVLQINWPGSIWWGTLVVYGWDTYFWWVRLGWPLIQSDFKPVFKSFEGSLYLSLFSTNEVAEIWSPVDVLARNKLKFIFLLNVAIIPSNAQLLSKLIEESLRSW